jgi:hypothetical protein
MPGDFRRDEAWKAFIRQGQSAQRTDSLVDRLRANGILEQREVAGISFLRFSLDPAAEYLAALAWMHQVGSDTEQWARLLADLERLPTYPMECDGFLKALSTCYSTYRDALRLPKIRLPWENGGGLSRCVGAK